MNKLTVLKNYLSDVIKNKELHNWNSLESCHCGGLLQSCGLYDADIIDDDEVLSDEVYQLVRKKQYSGWYKFAFELYNVGNIQCHITNLPFTTVVNQLLSYGFTLNELIDLEHLQDKRFINLNITDNEVTNVDNLILYLTNWVNYEQQLVKVNNTETVKVSC